MSQSTEVSGAFPTTDVFRAHHVLVRKLIISAIGLAFFGFITWSSYFSNDPYNSIYLFFGPVALCFLGGLILAIRQFINRPFEIRINADGFYILQPGLLFWPWSGISGVSSQKSVVTLNLANTRGYDQGMWDRTEVQFSAKPLDQDAATIEKLIQTGIESFAKR